MYVNYPQYVRNALNYASLVHAISKFESMQMHVSGSICVRPCKHSH